MPIIRSAASSARFTWLAFLGLFLFFLIILACILALLQPAVFAGTGRLLSFPAFSRGGSEGKGPFGGDAMATATSRVSRATAVSAEGTMTAATATADAREPTLTVAFASGGNEATTKKEYKGPVTITIKGSGQAAGKKYSDAFYIYTDEQGNPITPTRVPVFATLCINEKPSSEFVQPIPPYSETHMYTVTVNAPGGHLTFGVCDDNLSDNTGSFTITFAE